MLFIDCTKSNIENGIKSFGGRSLHDVSDAAVKNPYVQAISIIGKTLAPFDADGYIPAYGFGDKHTKDTSVFPFFNAKDKPKGDLGFEAVIDTCASSAGCAPLARQAGQRAQTSQ